jgi:hypothetical protein
MAGIPIIKNTLLHPTVWFQEGLGPCGTSEQDISGATAIPCAILIINAFFQGQNVLGVFVC